MNTAKIGRIAYKISDSAKRIQSYARDAAGAARNRDFFGVGGAFGRENASETNTALANAKQRLKAELEELTGLVEELGA